MWKIVILASFVIHCTCGQDSCQSSTVPLPSPTSDPSVLVSFTLSWDVTSQNLYYTDANADQSQPQIFRYSPADDKSYSCNVPGQVNASFVAPIQNSPQYNNTLLVAFGSTAYIVEWDDVSPTAKIVGTLFVIPVPSGSDIRPSVGRRLGNSAGVFYFGQLHTAICNAPADTSYYRYSKAICGIETIFTGVVSSLGIASDIINQKAYHLDGCTELLTQYDLDPNTGNICNGRTIFNFNSTGAHQIGLTVSESGNLYSIDYYTGAVYRIVPGNGNATTVTTIATIGIPGGSSIQFGGSDRKTLYVGVSSRVFDRSGNIQSMRNVPSLYKIGCVGDTGRTQLPLNLG